MSGADFSTPMSICIRRRNPVRIPRRDILVQASDTPTLAMTIYQQDTDTAPLDISGAAFLISIYRERAMRPWGMWWDYGFMHLGLPYIVATFGGTLVNPTQGRVDFMPLGDPSQCLIGRFAYELTMSYPQDASSASGIGVVSSAGNPVTQNYAQGNYTICRGIMELPQGAVVPLTTASGFFDSIGVSTAVQLLGADGDALLGADGALLVSAT